MTMQQHQAMMLLKKYTREYSWDNAMYGPFAASARAEILSALTGMAVSKSKAAWGVFRKAVEELCGADGNCIAVRDKQVQRVIDASA